MNIWYDQLIELTKKELRARYKTYFFGYFWSVANPLVLALTFYFALKMVMKIQIEDYPLFLISGLFPWQWVANSLSGSANIFINNVSLIKKLNFRRELIPLSMILNDLFHFCVSIPIILLFSLHYGKPVSFSLIFLPVVIVSQFMIVYGLSLAISSINLFFRDLERIVTIILTILFYTTPVLYPHTYLPENYSYVIYFNPMSPVIILYHQLFLEGFVQMKFLFLSFCYGVVILSIGYYIYNSLKWKFAEIL
ncbi:MAG: ABC transporter permease [Planctomycetes bacterium]|nr:ABC transporter permease [Planctomycetota bacterium]